MRTIFIAISAAMLVLAGCSSTMAYHPRIGPEQSLRYAQGVGTLSERLPDHDLFMYPTFKTQGTSQPTFTIGYANNSIQSENFSTANVKAYYRGSPVSVYTYFEKIEEIRQEKVGKQVALAILGAAATVAATNSASRQTYSSNYSGVVGNRNNAVFFRGSNQVRVYDPGSGLLAGAAAAGATGLGISQLEYSAQNEEAAANAILQENTVDPQHMVSGQVMLKGCCDRDPSPNDVIRFEVTVNNKTSVFEFLRLAGGVAPPPQIARAAPVFSAAAATAADSVSTIRPIAPSSVIQPATASPRSRPYAIRDAFVAERTSEALECSARPIAVLTAHGPGFESYTVACSNGDSLAIRCEFGNCRALK